jgi:hypothetical protein
MIYIYCRFCRLCLINAWKEIQQIRGFNVETVDEHHSKRIIPTKEGKNCIGKTTETCRRRERYIKRNRRIVKQNIYETSKINCTLNWNRWNFYEREKESVAQLKSWIEWKGGWWCDNSSSGDYRLVDCNAK